MMLKAWFLVAAFLISLPSMAKEMDLVKEVKKRTQALAEYQEQRREILDVIYQIQVKIKAIAKNQTQITARAQRLKVEMSKSQEELQQMEKTLSALRHRLGKSAMLLAHVDAGSMLKVLFAAKSPAELDRTIKFFELIIQREMKVVRQFQVQVQKVVDKQNEIHLALSEIQRTEQEMVTTEQNLKQEHQQKLQLISKLDQRRQQEVESLRALKLKSLREIAAELDRDKVIAEFLRPSFLDQKGRLAPPLSGNVLGLFGVTTDPDLQTQTPLDGWFISAQESDEVRVPFDGKIALVHRDSKLNSVVIVDHGHDYYTTYSGLSEARARVGESVTANQVIGKAGYSPRWRADGVHFEIRHFSEALDPSRWLLTGKSVQKQASIYEQR
jgi:septal ring factor EnvC (AmiA/AmiB activator)